MTAPSVDVAQLRAQYAAAGQDQVFAFYDHLPPADQAALVQQLAGFDPHRISALAKAALHPASADVAADTSLAPLPDSATASLLDASPADVDTWYRAGLDLIARNQVAVVLMAGGQGTRLGSTAPKGCFDIGLPSHKSLFQIQAERIRRLQTLAGGQQHQQQQQQQPVVIPWYIMTSGPTRAATEAFFVANGYFGLDPSNVVFFEQGVLPCLSLDGRILLETPGRVAVAPDGNGGLYAALAAAGVLDDLAARGIEHVHAYCVDNCLVRVADPVFLGWAAARDADVATKVVRKRSATEPVGLIVCKGGKPGVVEYSEIDAATAALWAAALPHHVARKKIPYADAATAGQTVAPTKPNGIKLEQFVFDVFPRVPLARFACLEVRRADEFSPLKNARGTGEDDPDTSRRDVLQQGRRWLEAAGATVVVAAAAAAAAGQLRRRGPGGVQRHDRDGGGVVSEETILFIYLFGSKSNLGMPGDTAKETQTQRIFDIEIFWE
ncbi:UTP-glucose-1-phosphate uridylyltransferase [Niveomyces insectorum RCEF 264]|uniref:UDP-N-acetylglucosamine diphosphorylase n=1 Tax=Niveomyces insectorum RCEF 264 TaxID=1081102 RepID=A0A167VLK3_9HYPO|nr:UTP-glucose-1-phosphate uridylyltransferase [Niveomyces insectorum RCEF 264]